MTRLSSLLVLAATALGAAQAAFRVVAPVRANNSAIDHELALFGRPPYGGSLEAALALPPSANEDGCRPYNTTALAISLKTAGIHASTSGEGVDDEAFVLLVRRGDCHFVDKVRHAQHARAAAVVIYDTEPHAKSLPVLADDGTGSDIHIPSIIVHQKTAEDLVSLVHTGAKTIVSLSWDVPHPDDRVEVALWFSSRMAPQIQSFISHFRPVVAALGASILFTPYYDVHLGSAWGCTGGDAAEPTHCPQLCVYDNKYCAFDPEQNNTIGLDGRDLIEEAVRQLCVYELANSTHHAGLYWDYLVAFNTQCSVRDATAAQFNRLCSRRVQDKLGIRVDECEAARGEQLLQSQVDALREYHVMQFPELTVNGVRMYGTIACESPAACSPLQMICAGFSDATAPPACQPGYWEGRHPSSPTTCAPPRELDACGQCSHRGTKAWNAQCAGCDGVPHSGAEPDECGVCGGDGTIDVCGRCLPAADPLRNKSCLDCQGVPNGFAQRDACGVCGGHGSFDACGLCLDATDPRRQNFACHVIEDPDAVAAKVELRGVGMKQFHGATVASFQRAVAFAVELDTPDHVLVKSVDTAGASTTEVLFFIACGDAACRARVTEKLADASAMAVAIAVKMKTELLANGAETSDVADAIEKVTLHMGRPQDTLTVEGKASMWPAFAVAMTMATAVGVLLLRVRDDRLRRDVRELFARYTPLTSLEDEDEGEYGFSGSGAGSGSRSDATAW